MKSIKLLLLTLPFLLPFISSSQTWQPVGGGLNSSTHCLTTWNGKLVVGGSFNNNPCDRIALWNGSSYECLAGGVGIVARDACVWQGNLVVVGDFWNNFQPCVGCNGVAVWNGTAWTPLGTGVNNDVLVCTVWNNQLVIAGDFTSAGGQPISRIAKWNGTAWEGIGTPTDFTNDIRAMVEFEGELWVGGDFNNVAGCTACDGLVKWDPATSTWLGGNSGVDLIGGVDQSVRVLYVNPTDGNLYMGGEFIDLHDGDAPAPDPNMDGIAMYDGSNWTPLGTGLNQYCRAIHEYNGNIVAGGWFTTAGGVSANRIAKWNGTTWSPMGLGFDLAGIDEYVKAAAVWNGIFFAGGAYTQAEGNPMSFISQWYEAPVGSPTPWINYSSQTLCGSGCIDFLDNSTNNPTSWNWTFPGSNTPTSTQQNPGSVCWSAPGNYNVTLQACNSFGCNTQTLPITVTSGATVSVNDAAICGGGPATLTAVPSTPGGSFLWTPGGQTTASITVNPASTTNYTVTYSYLGCTSSDISTVTVGSGPSVTISGGNSVCQGQSITLTATPSGGGGTYLWSPGGQTTQSITVSPSSTTNYTVEYTLNGCTSTPVTQTVTISTIPTVTVPDAVICGGGSTTLTATPSTGGGTYVWSPGGQSTPSITVSPSSTTSYSVVYTLNGCSSPPDVATVSVNSTPTLTVTNQSICAGQSVTLAPTPSAGGGSFLWSPGGQTTPTITVSPSSTTSYGVNYTLNGCTSPTQTITVNVTAVPTLTVNNPTICAGQSATLTASPSVGGGAYQWTPGGQITNSITVSPGSSSTYTVQYSLNGCSTSQTSSVTVNPTYSLNQNVSACSNTLVTFPDGSSQIVTSPMVYTSSLNTAAGCDSIIVTNVSIAPSYSNSETVDVCIGSSYTFPDGSSAVINNNMNYTSSLTTVQGCDSIIITTVNAVNVINTAETIPLCSGENYIYPDGTPANNVTVNESHVSTLTSVGGCDSIVTTYLVVNPVPVLTSSNGTTCAGETITLTATGSPSGGSYLWSPGGQTTQSIVVNPSTTTTYTVTYTLNGCISNVSTSIVTVTPMPNNATSVANNTITATQNGASYQWVDCNNGMSPIAGATNQSFSPTQNGVYAVQITLNGCTATSSCVTINTIGLGENQYDWLSIFPNPTGDYLEVRGGLEVSFTYRVMDAAGKIAMSGTLLSGDQLNVKALSPGTYLLELDGMATYRFVKE